MEHIAALLMVIGCSGDLKVCEEIPTEVSVFETRQDCAAELVSAQRLYGRHHDTAFFKCVSVDPAVDDASADLVWDINPDGVLHAAVETLEEPGAMVAYAETTPRHNRAMPNTFAAN
ncbi:hypothetical protein [Aquibium oceanicum]|uniref:Uncharacterized protein n=1 Tax=Aquibium oceanicum TaxID=1670800 RepID=A0A1L3SXL6_9HYPH|nr:hypothetical protein [Aquibium oceanicum]APH74045.1 hypothetical protein BSQ44_23750 [Aquibium oceanicum]